MTAAAPALIAPVATPIHKTMLLLSALGTAKSIWPAGLLKGCLALLLGAAELQELRKKTFQPGTVSGSWAWHWYVCTSMAWGALRSLLPNQEVGWLEFLNLLEG